MDRVLETTFITLAAFVLTYVAIHIVNALV